MTLITCPLHAAARRWGEAPALIGPGLHYSYEQLDARVGGLVLALQRQGVESGQHLGYIGPNGVSALLLLLACIRLGSVFVPLSPRFPEAQRKKLAEELDLAWLVTEDDQTLPALKRLTLEAEPVAQIWRAEADKPLTLVLTSGSSGHPKAAMHTLAHHLAAAEGSQDQTPLERGDSWLASLPLFHIGGIAILFRTLGCGATLVLPDENGLADNLGGITHLSLVATQLKRLLDRDDASALLSGLKAVLLGGGPIPAKLLERLTSYPFKTLTSYGMTEMGSQITTGPANAQGLSGFPLAGRQVRLNGDLIEVKGDCLFLGYYRHGKLKRPFDAEGWFATRDKGRFIGEQLKVLGRADNCFISGGENIQPEAIEAVIKQVEGITEAVVVPVADEEFGQLPVAVIQGDYDSKALERRLGKKLPRFMRPRRFLSWPDSLEQTGLKVSRQAIGQYVLKRDASI